MTNTLVGSDRRDLEAKVGRLLERRGDTSDPGAFLDNLEPERIAGTPEQVLERLAQYAEAGVQRVMLQHILHDDLESLALIGAEVIPSAAGL
jgi:alkanesulfonate monooxygenase SsuD/methylene tetrahydromethanopterin reductase-like flavin-dependent oxidoreductase (luciferase family)